VKPQIAAGWQGLAACLAGLLGCGGTATTDPSPMGSDAEVADAARPDAGDRASQGGQDEGSPYRTLELKFGVERLALTPDARRLVFCTGGGRYVGFVDADSLSLVKTLDLDERYPWLRGTGPCSMAVIGDHAYAYYGPGGDSGAGIVKVSLAHMTVLGGWQIPKEMAGNETSFPGLHGRVQKTTHAGEAIVTIRRSDVRDGIAALFVDLETGALSTRTIAPFDGVSFQEVLAVVDGDKILGRVAPSDSTKPLLGFLLRLADGKFLWTLESFEAGRSLEVDETGRRIVMVDAAIFRIHDLDTGRPLAQHETVGGSDWIRFLPGNRIVTTYLTSAVRITDIKSGGVRSEIDLGRVGHLDDAAVSPDGTHLFLTADEWIIDLPVPEAK
jgi:hypothetical protein